MYGYRFYNFNNSEMIKEYLEKMALKGYRLVSLKNQIYKFERIAPTKLYYDITYLHGENVFDSDNNEQQQNFIAFCEQGGWQYRCSWQNMKIFSSEEKLLPIDTDSDIKFSCIHRTMKKTFLLNTALMLLVCLLNLSQLIINPVEVVVSSNMVITMVLFALLFVIMGIDFIGYWVWFFKCKKAIAQDTPLPGTTFKSYYRYINPVLYGISFVLIILMIAFILPNETMRPFVLLNGGMLIVIFILATLLRKFLKRQNLGYKLSFTIFIIAIVVAVAVQNVLLVSFIFSRDIAEGEDVYTIQAQHREIAIYNDDIPLTLQQLGVEVLEVNSYNVINDSSSFLVERLDASQRSYDSEGNHGPEFSYVVYKTDFSTLSRLILNDSMTRYDFYNYEPIDATPWAAEQAYQIYSGIDARNSYIIVKDNNIAIIHLNDIEVSDAQRQAITESLL